MVKKITKLGVGCFPISVLGSYPKNEIYFPNSWADTYKTIAYDIEYTFSDRRNGPLYIKHAMQTIVNLRESDEFGVDAAIYLLPKIRYFYNWILHYYDIEDNRKLIVYQINNFTQRRKGDLTTFVNSISWDEGCAPFNWTDTSNNSCYDCSEWITCS